MANTVHQAKWNGEVVAESDQCVKVEGNYYFPPDSIKKDYFRPTSTTSHCGWKGEASYYTLVVNGQENKDAAWFYGEPKDAAREIKDYVAFWRGVKVT